MRGGGNFLVTLFLIKEGVQVVSEKTFGGGTVFACYLILRW